MTASEALAMPPDTRNSVEERISAAIAAFRCGEMVVVTDDDDRENEGDVFVAASFCTIEQMAFMIRHTSGIICAPAAAEEAKRLNLTPMVSVNDAPLGTAFTVSVDARDGLTTGISATERCATVRALSDGRSQAADFVRPGHVFPLIAREGGVLMRSGHTEACVDLCRYADLPRVGVLAELMNDDGSVMRGPEIARFAQHHGLRRFSIADLIAYAHTRQQLIRRVATFPVSSRIGPLTAHSFNTVFDEIQHFVFVFGDLLGGENVLTRLHRANVITDLFGGAPDIQIALDRFEAEGQGVLVCLRDAAGWVPMSTIPRPDSSENARRQRWREVGLGAQILSELGVRSIRNISTKDLSYVGLDGFGIQIVSTEPIRT